MRSPLHSRRRAVRGAVIAELALTRTGDFRSAFSVSRAMVYQGVLEVKACGLTRINVCSSSKWFVREENDESTSVEAVYAIVYDTGKRVVIRACRRDCRIVPERHSCCQTHL